MTDDTTEAAATAVAETATAETAPADAAPADAAPSDAAPAVTDTPPDRLSNNPNSLHYDATLLERGIGIRFKGVERTNVDEYCVSESWVRLTVAGSKDRYGNPITIKQQGEVVPYFRS
jgi:hypothetical protein